MTEITQQLSVEKMNASIYNENICLPPASFSHFDNYQFRCADVVGIPARFPQNR